MPDNRSGVSSGAPSPLDLPATFGKYFLTEKLATGGMAEIYLAKIVGPGGFEKQLVIKQIHPRLTGQRHFVDLFVAEAKILVTLTHGNIVPVYELGVIDDTYFIAMEYIDGPTLYRLTEALRRQDIQMAPPIAAWITARILEGLDYAHRKGEGVIHRDLSPRNVMLSRDGDIKLVDFGIAVTLGTTGDGDPGASAPTGSFPYMSPEQVRRETLTVQTDLFSVGVLLWEMLAGHRLFARSDADATLHAVIASEIERPSAAHADVPSKLDDVVMRALERDVAARWGSAGEMLAALQRYLYGLPDPPRPRDVAALVARYCPPETRRFPTHADWAADGDAPDAHDGHDATQPRAANLRALRADSVDGAPRPGPATAVLPRPGASPRGKRPSRARTETFATHVALEQILEGAAPTGSAASEADDAVPRGDATPLRPGRNTAAAQSRHRDAVELDEPHGADAPGGADGAVRSDAGAAVASGEPAAHPGPPPIQIPGRVAPPASLLLLAGVGALALGGAAIFVFYRGRAAVERPDAAPRRDAPAYAFEPDAPLGSPTPTTSIELLDAAAPPEPADAPSAPVPADADVRLALPRDATLRPVRPQPGDVALPAHPDAAPAIAGTAALTIGANPWGNVLVDGKRIGRTPIEHLSVAAGHHTIEVIFAGEDPPRTLKYTVDVASGETRDVLADFTKSQ